jgi:flagellar motor switch protein FliN/FliY
MSETIEDSLDTETELEAATDAPDAQALVDEEVFDSNAASSTAALDEAAAAATSEEEDPWAAALAEQEAAGGMNDEPAAEEPTAHVRGGGHEVFQPLATSTDVADTRDLEIVMNIPVKLNVELGRTKISIRQLLELAQGSVLELDGLAGDPMDIFINGYLIAQGEVVVVEDRYGIRITDIITPTERVEKLNR